MAAYVFSTLLCLGWLIPDHFPPWMAFHNEVPAFAALIAAGACTAWQQRGTRGAGLGAGTWVCGLLLAVAAIQYLSGQLPYKGDLALVVLYVGGAGLAWQLGRSWTRDTKTAAIDTLAIAFATGATLSALMACIQWAEQEGAWLPWVMSAAHSSRGVANLAQPNQLSTLLLMGTIATALLYTSDRISGAMALLLTCLQTSALVLTQSRTGMVVVLLLVTVSPWALRSCKRLHWRSVAAWGLVFGWMTLVFQGFGQTASKPALGGQALQIGLRPLLWQQFGEALAKAPWLGYGWLQTPRAQQQGALGVPGLEQAVYTHNQVLDLAVWMGIPLTLAILFSALAWAWSRRQGLTDPKLALCAVWLIPLGCHAMLEFPLAYGYFLFPAAVIAGMFDKWTETSPNKNIMWSRPVGSAVLTLYACIAAAVFMEYLQAEEDFRVARFENRNIGQTPTKYSAPDLVVLDQLGTVLKAMRLRAQPGMSEQDLKLLKRASDRYSWAALHFRYALAMGLNQHIEQASAQMYLIRNLYGEEIYAEAREDFLRKASEEYPELAKVRIP